MQLPNPITNLKIYSLIILPVLILLMSCSTGNPVLPGAAADPVLAVQEQITPSTPLNNHYLWGYYSIYVDPQENIVMIFPLRDVAAHWNVLKWLEQGPCTDCVSVININPTGSGTKEFTVKIEHPFANPNLTGFDVRGIAMFAGSHSFPFNDLTTPDRAEGDGELVNPDGYTTLYNGLTAGSGPGGLQGYLKGKFASLTVPDATLNGYKRHVSTGYDARNIFLAGDSVTAVYELDMPDSAFIFGYAVDASWIQATTLPVTIPETDFPPSANCPEPWKILASDLPVGTGLNSKGGSTTLTIDVYDWQGMDSHETPVVECPELFSGIETASFVSDFSIYSRWEVMITNSNTADVGTYKCLIKVPDDENIGSPDWLDLTAYQIYDLTVVEWMDITPVPLASADPLLQAAGQSVEFSDNGSYDPDSGAIVSYEWDWDNDGTYDESGSVVSHIFATSGDYLIGFRVTDDDGSYGVLDPPLAITIHDLPVGSVTPMLINTQINTDVPFDATGSNDPDGGSITKYEWDWIGDGTYVEGPAITDHAWDTEGTYFVQLRVTDDEDATAILAVPVMVNVFGGGWVRTWGSTGSDKAQDVAIRSNGDSYTFGTFTGVVDFDPGATVEEHSAAGNTDLFVCKYTNDGTYQWTKTWGGTGIDGAKGICMASNVFKIYITGYFRFTVDFDPGAGVEELSTNADSLDAFLLCLDLDGNFQWVRAWGGTSTDEGMDVLADGFGDPYVPGIYQETVDFDPGAGTVEYTSNGIYDCSLSRFDSAGNFMWARSWGGSNIDLTRAIAFTHQGSEFTVVGSYTDTTDFDTGAGTYDLTPVGGQDCFMTQYDPDGNWVWAKGWGGTGNDEAFDIDSDAWNQMGVTGYFADTVNFDLNGGIDNISSFGGSDSFVMTLDSGGWQESYITWGGLGEDQSLGIAYYYDPVSVESDFFVTGYFNSNCEFQTGPVEYMYLSSSGLEDIFIAKWDPLYGYFRGAHSWGGSSGDAGYRIRVSDTGNTYTAGSFMDVVDFDPDAVTEDNRTSGGAEDSFLLKTTPGLTW